MWVDFFNSLSDIVYSLSNILCVLCGLLQRPNHDFLQVNRVDFCSPLLTLVSCKYAVWITPVP